VQHIPAAAVNAAGTAANFVGEKLSAAGQWAAEKATEVGSATVHSAQEAIHSLTGLAGEAKAKADEATEQAKEKGAELKDQASEKIDQAKDKANELASDAQKKDKKSKMIFNKRLMKLKLKVKCIHQQQVLLIMYRHHMILMHLMEIQQPLKLKSKQQAQTSLQLFKTYFCVHILSSIVCLYPIVLLFLSVKLL